MFGLGITEIAVILVVALLFIGPDKLPEVAKSLGRGLRELRKVTDDVRDTVNDTVNDAVRNVASRPTPPKPPEPSPPLPGSGMTTSEVAANNAPPVENAPVVKAPEGSGERVKATPGKDPVA